MQLSKQQEKQAERAPSPGLAAVQSDTSGLPLAGVRVLDMTQVWAGPFATKLLADLGAEIFKVESLVRPDPERLVGGGKRSQFYPQFEPGARYFDRAARFNEYNGNKLGITLDLKAEEGLQLLKRLVQVSDVVVENFSADVMDRLGLGYEVLRALKPDIIMVSMAGFGNKGPEAHFRSYGPIQEAMSGLTSITGYVDEPRLETNEYYGDPTGAAFGAAGMISALFYKHRTGRGTFIDLSQREAMVTCLPELVLDKVMTGRIDETTANRHQFKAPHGCYPCTGEDKWLVLAVGSDDEWAALCGVIGKPDLAADPRFATVLERFKHQDELDVVIEAWTREQHHYAAMHALQAAGVAAEAVINHRELVEDPHYNARGFIQRVDQGEAGEHLTLRAPWKISDAPIRGRRHAPGLGEHNRLILHDLLGLADEEIDALALDGVIGDTPAG